MARHLLTKRQLAAIMEDLELAGFLRPDDQRAAGTKQWKLAKRAKAFLPSPLPDDDSDPGEPDGDDDLEAER
jgi:hypothetical protein